ncbi:MAG: hypothetical protein IJU03_03235, partial [Thermoguttaceae bacterium]|nr:hypothetical protein [Thermoguttaceae bacterium]
LLFFAACYLALRGARGVDRREALRDELCLLAPGLTLFVFVSLQSGFSKHFRYVLPAAPCFYIFASSVFAEKNLSNHAWRRFLAYCSLAWFVIGALSVFPHSLSYFNELAGGPRNAWRYFLDSNLDWGQDTYALQAWLDRRGQKDVMVKLRDQYAESSALIVNYPRIPILIDQLPAERLLDDEEKLDARLLGPRPGTYAISVDALYGSNGKYRYLRELEPVERIGYSFNIYEIDWDECDRLREKYGLPPLTRPQEDGERFFGEFCRRSRTIRPIRAAFIEFREYDDSFQTFQRIFAEEIEGCVERIAPWQVKNGELDGFDLVIAPGGRASEQARALGVEGVNAIRRFVEGGGGYFGVCAGAYLASTNEHDQLRLINLLARHETTYVPEKGLMSIISDRRGRVDLALSQKGAELCENNRETELKNVFYFTGPIFQPGFQADMSQPIILATFATETSKYDFQRGSMIGAPAIAIAPFGEGTVVVTSLHLEEDARNYSYLRALIRGATRDRKLESNGAIFRFTESENAAD